jgi:septal ring factor EnvC (AmiA/AmiB activator)
MRIALYTTRQMRAIVCVAVLGVVALGVSTLGVNTAAQGPAPETPTRRVSDRIRALEREASQLAGQARTLVGELRALEIERNLKADAAMAAEAALDEARRSLQQTSDRIAALDKQRIEQLPQLKAQLVDLYKHGGAGYARLLFDVGGVRDFARATRVVTAMATLRERQIEQHRRTIEGLARERSTLGSRSQQLQTTDAEARRARAEAERALAAHNGLIAQIDSRRDLNAEYVGELQLAYERLTASGTTAARGAAAAGPASAIPLAPFRGVLPWPAAGRLRARFGQTDGRLGGSALTNGVELASTDGASVRAVHGGTVTYADPFTGFGTMVIIDHGGNHSSLYGYLGTAAVRRGDAVEAGAELGRAGLSPAGQPAVYFELRIDGRSVDPVQWLLPAGSR